MKNLKLEKGITLIALIITIIILLILAVVTIGSMKNSNIITYAQNASTDYNREKDKEKGILVQYETTINEHQGIGPWKLQEDGETIKNSETDVETMVGGEFSNEDILRATGGAKSSYDGTWTVLGVEKGRLKLVSTENVKEEVSLGCKDTNVPADLVDIFNKEGELANLNLEKAIWSYNNAIDTLNSYAQKATGIAGARSITITDIDILLGKNAGYGNDDFYGKTVKYKVENGKVNSYIKNINGEFECWGRDEIYEVFIDNKGTIVDLLNREQIIYIEDFYEYGFNMSERKNYSYITKPSKNYWLASPCVMCSRGSVLFCIGKVETISILHDNLFNSDGNWNDNVNNKGIRAIVYI